MDNSDNVTAKKNSILAAAQASINYANLLTSMEAATAAAGEDPNDEAAADLVTRFSSLALTYRWPSVLERAPPVVAAIAAVPQPLAKVRTTGGAGVADNRFNILDNLIPPFVVPLLAEVGTLGVEYVDLAYLERTYLERYGKMLMSHRLDKKSTTPFKELPKPLIPYKQMDLNTWYEAGRQLVTATVAVRWLVESSEKLKTHYENIVSYRFHIVHDAWIRLEGGKGRRLKIKARDKEHQNYS